MIAKLALGVGAVVSFNRSIEQVRVRDSKLGAGSPVLVISFQQWQRFLTGQPSNIRVSLRPDGSTTVQKSDDLSGPTLLFTPGEWAAFVDGVPEGEFDLPTSVPAVVG